MMFVYVVYGCYGCEESLRLSSLMAMEEKEAKSIRVKTDTDEFVLYGRPCELSAFSYVAPNRQLPKERTYFNVHKKVRHVRQADVADNTNGSVINSALVMRSTVLHDHDLVIRRTTQINSRPTEIIFLAFCVADEFDSY